VRSPVGQENLGGEKTITQPNRNLLKKLSPKDNVADHMPKTQAISAFQLTRGFE
jgi:hypothetical protein